MNGHRTLSGQLQVARLVAQIAFQNLIASKWRTAIIGAVIGFGALVLLLGAALLHSVDGALNASVTESLAGHIQVYSAKSEGRLDLMGDYSSGLSTSLEPLADFDAVRSTLLGVDNVKSVVPMALSEALIATSAPVDVSLARLRSCLHEHAPQCEPQKRSVRRAAEAVSAELQADLRLGRATRPQADADAIIQLASAEFWRNFDADPFGRLELLESHLTSDVELMPIRLMGTDPDAFARAFDRMQIKLGTAIPVGRRGLLLSQQGYDSMFKLKVAHRLDKLRRELEERHATIRGSRSLQRLVRENVRAIQDVLVQLDDAQAATLARTLQSYLHTETTDLSGLLSQFFAMTDETFSDRYRFFYANVASQLQLYRVKVGEDIIVKAVARSGYVRSRAIKLWGTYTFRGLESSPQAGTLHMLDLVSLRELFGLTHDESDEVAQLRREAGATFVARASAEQELFGTRQADSEDAAPRADIDRQLAELEGTQARLRASFEDAFDPKLLREGPVLNVAVHLLDASKLSVTQAAIERAGRAHGLPLRAVTWETAAGYLGQFTSVMKAVLFAAVLIIFAVALVVINNALVMAALHRCSELGTLRALGAQRSFVVGTLVVESLVVGTGAGAIGAAAAASLLVALGHKGIPATNDVMTFICAGPRLVPSFSANEIVATLLAVIVVSLLSSIGPAWIALSVSPREAMQADR